MLQALSAIGERYTMKLLVVVVSVTSTVGLLVYFNLDLRLRQSQSVADRVD